MLIDSLSGGSAAGALTIAFQQKLESSGATVRKRAGRNEWVSVTWADVFPKGHNDEIVKREHQETERSRSWKPAERTAVAFSHTE